MIAFAKGEHITFFVNHQSDPEIAAERILCVQILRPRDSPFSREPRWINNRPLGSFKHVQKEMDTIKYTTNGYFLLSTLTSFIFINLNIFAVNEWSFCFTLLFLFYP